MRRQIEKRKRQRNCCAGCRQVERKRLDVNNTRKPVSYTTVTMQCATKQQKNRTNNTMPVEKEERRINFGALYGEAGGGGWVLMSCMAVVVRSSHPYNAGDAARRFFTDQGRHC